VTSGMRVVRWDPADAAALRGCQTVWGAALDIDDPDGPRMTGQVLAAYLRHGFTSDPAEAWFVPGTGAAEAATRYSLVRWTGPTPAEYRAALANVFNAYADAPHDEGYEAEAWDADRVRERADALLQAWECTGTRSRRATTRAVNSPR
jgi:hypothetical protein